MYFAADADLNYNESGKEDSELSSVTVKSEKDEQILVKTEDTENVHSLSKSQVALVNDLMEEAMKESKIVEPNNKKIKGKRGKTIYYERCEDEVNNDEAKCISLGSELVNDVNRFEIDDKDDSWEEEFCIIQNEAGIGMMVSKFQELVHFNTIL